jgi:hypothetical protein
VQRETIYPHILVPSSNRRLPPCHLTPPVRLRRREASMEQPHPVLTGQRRRRATWSEANSLRQAKGATSKEAKEFPACARTFHAVQCLFCQCRLTVVHCSKKVFRRRPTGHPCLCMSAGSRDSPASSRTHGSVDFILILTCVSTGIVFIDLSKKSLLSRRAHY